MKNLLRVVIAVVMVAAAVLWWQAPEIRVLNRVNSPDNKLAVMVETEEYRSMFTPPFYLVVIRPQNYRLFAFRENKLFEISQLSAATPPVVEWRGTKQINIATSGKPDDISLQIYEYDGIKISYENVIK